MLDTEDYGKDLATVQNLVKKHQLLDADINAHEERIGDLNQQADVFIDSGVLDTESIEEKKRSINERYERCAIIILYCPWQAVSAASFSPILNILLHSICYISRLIHKS